ncbi:MAG: GAF domain-containing protein [Pseudomonadota bacterium]|nr:GAF domain-containing protein [Pseudomonadota bacterium]
MTFAPARLDPMELVHASIGRGQEGGPAGLRGLLEVLARQVGAEACVLWAEATRKSGAPTVRLLARAAWVAGDAHGFLPPDLPLARSVTGEAILRQEPRRVAVDDPHLAFGAELARQGVHEMVAIPLRLGGTRATVNLYFPDRVRDPDALLAELAVLPTLLPALYEAVRDRGAVRLLNDFEQDVRDSAAPVVQDQEAAEQGWRARLAERLVAHAARLFDAFEVSTFLQQDLRHGGRWSLVASTVPARVRRCEYREDQGGTGITTWVLRERRAVRIFDKVRMARDADDLADRYEGLTWDDSLEIRPLLQEQLGVGPDAIPPVSAMVVPVHSGGRFLGALRVCAPRHPPFYFAEDDLRNLEVAAAQLGGVWGASLERSEARRLAEEWSDVARTLARESENVARNPAQSRAGQQAAMVALASRVVSGAHAAIGRRLDGDLRLERLDVSATTNPGLPLPTSGPSAGAEALQKGQSIAVPADDPRYEPLVPDMRWQLSAPIALGRHQYGVIDVYTRDRAGFTPAAQDYVMPLLGTHLALSRRLSQVVRDLEARQKDEALAYQDLAHQLKTPINQAILRASKLLKMLGASELTLYDLDAIRSEAVQVRGLFRRARRVAQSLRVLADHAQKKALALHLEPMEVHRISRLLGLAAADGSLQARRIRVRVEVDEEAVKALFEQGVTALVDYDLLEQCVYNVLDNAIKYSWRGERVTMSVERAGTAGLALLFRNKGIALAVEDLPRAKTRGWRSEAAEAITGAGSGLGLWIVDQVMAVHNGTLDLRPTVGDVTEVCLCFPG